MNSGGQSTVFITGANRGLGLELARQYATDGWRVLATYRDIAQAHELRQVCAAVYALDVTDLAGIARLGQELIDETVDVFIANAGAMASPGKSVREIDESLWITDFRVNVLGPLACAAAFLAQVSRAPAGKMIAMSSGLASIERNTTGGQYAYRASKAALNAAWKSLAVDHPEIIAAVVAPGALRTDMTRHDPVRWHKLPEPAENLAKLRNVIAGLTPTDSGGYFAFDGQRVPW